MLTTGATPQRNTLLAYRARLRGVTTQTSETADAAATCLFVGDSEDSFAFRAAQACGTRRFHAADEPGSRADFLQALQQLGAEPEIHRLHSRRSTCRMMPMHVSCSQDNWTEIFGEPECVEEIITPSTEHVLYRWKHACADGSVTCMGHLFEQSPGVHWVVVMRIMFL